MARSAQAAHVSTPRRTSAKAGSPSALLGTDDDDKAASSEASASMISLGALTISARPQSKQRSLPASRAMARAAPSGTGPAENTAVACRSTARESSSAPGLIGGPTSSKVPRSGSSSSSSSSKASSATPGPGTALGDRNIAETQPSTGDVSRHRSRPLGRTTRSATVMSLPSSSCATTADDSSAVARTTHPCHWIVLVAAIVKVQVF
mmetsp:Transcript_20367/g.81431  ORF Transcript_20367/g.81431 Transcript_20367/m.81431 type:complete len:207 (-) Transcript_20367:12-632(-)